MELFDGTGFMTFLYGGGGILLFGLLFMVVAPIAWVWSYVEDWRRSRRYKS